MLFYPANMCDLKVRKITFRYRKQETRFNAFKKRILQMMTYNIHGYFLCIKTASDNKDACSHTLSYIGASADMS